MKKILIVFAFAALVLSMATPAIAAHRWSRYQYRVAAVKPIATHIPTFAPVPAPAPGPLPAPTSSNFATNVETLVLQGTNTERVKNGLEPLSADTKLASIARAHSQDMLTNNYFSHTSIGGCSVSCRLNNAQYGWRSYGENIYWMSGFNLSAADTASKIVSGWMNSPGHRANILNSTFTVSGVGIALQGTKIYATADYALPR